MPFTRSSRRVHANARSDASAPSTNGHQVRPEIQALRAIAVLGVVAYHLWPSRLTGGFVGVDVFFVVSGFLITDHLLREVDRKQTVQLLGFWARRVRRLLPASFLTIAATAVAIYLLVPRTLWPQFGRELLTSTFYVQNWELAHQAVDYMGQTNTDSPTQHFWSLGVEEQFYIVWPILIVAVVLAMRRLRKSSTLAIGVILAAVVVLSLAWSIHLTDSDPARAYFVTTTRAWELGAGGVLAWCTRVWPGHLTGRDGLRSAISWCGLAMVVAAMAFYDDGTPFPGFSAALPVVGTLAVLVAGAPTGPASPLPLLRLKPAQFVGDISYGVYLWHWPLIVLLPYATGHGRNLPESVAILAASLVLGWASKRFVEDPARGSGRRSVPGPRRTFALLGVGSIAACLVIAPLARWSPPDLPDLRAEDGPCFGARAMTHLDECGNPATIELNADVTSFTEDVPPESILECEGKIAAAQVRRCEFNDPASPTSGVAVIGDSHASRWVEPLQDLAKRHDWQLSSFLLAGCPLASATTVRALWGEENQFTGCGPVTDDVLTAITSDKTIDTVIMTNRTRLYTGDGGLTPDEVASTITRLHDAGLRVVVLKDPPEMNPVPIMSGPSAAECLLNEASSMDCSLPRPEADFTDPMLLGAEAAGAPVIDLTDLFCDAERCYSKLGGVVVYSDNNHVTRTFAWSARDILDERLTAALQ